jgi:PAS domain S-box-containing protein
MNNGDGLRLEGSTWQGSAWLPEELAGGPGSAMLLEALFDGHPDMVLMVDAEGRIVAANPQVIEGFGYSRRELEGRSIGMLLPEKARERHAGFVAGFMQNPTWRNMHSGLDLSARDANGTEFQVDVMLRPFFAGGKQYGMAILRRLDTALTRSRAQVRALVESLQDYSINLLDAHGRILTWNEGSRRIHGLAAGEALGKRLAILFPPDESGQAEAARLLEEAARTGRSRNEGWRRGSKGELFPAETDLTALRDDTGKLAGFTRVLHDLTRHKKAEDALRESNRALAEMEQRLRLLVESVTDYAIYMLDPEGRIVTWNGGAERNTGYRAEEVLGRSFSIFFLPEDAEAGLPAQELAAARGGRFETEAWRRRKDGSKIWALVTLTAIYGPEGDLRGFAKVTRDMTPQKQAAEALRSLNAQLEQYRVIVQNVEDYALYTLDAEGRITSWGLGAQKVIGYAPEQVLGRHYSMFAVPEDLARGQPQQELEEATRCGRCATDNWRTRSDGTIRWSSGVLSAVRDEMGKLTGFIRVTRDMTKQKELEESLAKLNSDLEKRVAERTSQLEATVSQLRQKNDEVENFSKIVSRDLKEKEVLLREIHHRVKNNLQVVQSLLKMSARKLPDCDARLAVESTVERVHAMSMVHERLYQMPSLSALPLGDYLSDIFAGSIQAYSLAPSQVQLKLDVEEILLPLDRAVPFALLANELLSNSFKHGFPGSRRGTIAVSVHRMNGAIRMVVEDDGVGLPADFDAAKSNSMGLKLAANLAHQLGGRLEYSGGQGCRVEADFTRM